MPLPDSMRAPRTRPTKGESRPGRRLALALVVLAALLMLGWGMIDRGLWIPPIWGTSPTPPAADAPAATASAIPTATLPAVFALPSATATPASPLTPTSTLIRRRLDIPIGTDRKFVIHRVAEGEKLEQYALLYQTSVDAILFINYNLRNPAWTDVLVVIPLGFTDVADLPIFVVYQVKEEERGISVEALAKELRVSMEDLKYYNGMAEPWDRPLVGDLFLVPRPRPEP